MAKLHRSQFIKEIKENWPELTSAINAEDGLLHLEMAVIRQFAQHLIDTGNRENLVCCFSIVEKYQIGGNPHLQNAIDVSFVEDLDFKDTKRHQRGWAWELLPGNLKKLYISFHAKMHN